MHQRTNVNIRIFRKRWSLTLGCFFPVNILNNIPNGKKEKNYLIQQDQPD